MDMSFGKYKGKPVAWVLLKEPDYVCWMLNEGMEDKKEVKFIKKLIKILDEKPFVNTKCCGKRNCTNSVTRLSLYKGQFNSPYWFCDKCDMYSQGSLAQLTEIRKIEDAILYSDRTSIVQAFAEAKGVPNRKTSKALKEYFGY